MISSQSMKIWKLDLDMYRRAEDSLRGPLHVLIEEDFPEIGVCADQQGNPTRGGIIGYALAYGLMLSFIGYFFYFA